MLETFGVVASGTFSHPRIAFGNSESLVALQFLLGLETTDLLVTSAKQSNTWIDLNNQGVCHFVAKEQRSQRLQAFVESNEYRQRNYGDELFYRVANANLDTFINDVIGRAAFDPALAAYRQAKEWVERECPKPVGVCSDTGEQIPQSNWTPCYFADHGCGYQCVDNLFREDGKMQAGSGA